MTPEETLAEIAAEVERCTLCDLFQQAHRGVPGTGNAAAEVFLVGEAPSGYDDRSGTPFSGPTGRLLDELLALVGLDRSGVFLTNVVKHRTPEGRSPLPDELAACAPYLDRQIAAIDPLVVVTLGRYALAHFVPRGKITQMHGAIRQIRGRTLVAMYNPAAAIHQEGLMQTIRDDFARALPEALAQARARRAKGERPAAEDEPPEQLSLF